MTVAATYFHTKNRLEVFVSSPSRKNVVFLVPIVGATSIASLSNVCILSDRNYYYYYYYNTCVYIIIYIRAVFRVTLYIVAAAAGLSRFLERQYACAH